MGSTCPRGTHGQQESAPHPVTQNLTLPLRLDLALRDFQGLPGIDEVLILIGEGVDANVGVELVAVVEAVKIDDVVEAVKIDDVLEPPGCTKPVLPESWP